MKLLFAKTILAANIRAATSESAGVVVVADNFANAKDGESWVQLSPFGRFPNQLGLQVFTADDAKNICNEFNGVLGLPQRMMGLPFYIGHPDHPAFRDQYKDTRSYGRVKELECRHDAGCATCNTFANSTGGVPCEVHGLFGRTKWNDEGKQLIANETFNGHSVNWRLRKVGGEWHPFSLKSVGFTNEPNIPVKPIFAANEADEMETALLERRFCKMTVMRAVTAANEMAFPPLNPDQRYGRAAASAWTATANAESVNTQEAHERAASLHDVAATLAAYEGAKSEKWSAPQTHNDNAAKHRRAAAKLAPKYKALAKVRRK